jgi:hypothetical protein
MKIKEQNTLGIVYPLVKVDQQGAIGTRHVRPSNDLLRRTFGSHSQPGK